MGEMRASANHIGPNERELWYKKNRSIIYQSLVRKYNDRGNVLTSGYCCHDDGCTYRYAALLTNNANGLICYLNINEYIPECTSIDSDASSIRFQIIKLMFNNGSYNNRWALNIIREIKQQIMAPSGELHVTYADDNAVRKEFDLGEPWECSPSFNLGHKRKDFRYLSHKATKREIIYARYRDKRIEPLNDQLSREWRFELPIQECSISKDKVTTKLYLDTYREYTEMTVDIQEEIDMKDVLKSIISILSQRIVVRFNKRCKGEDWTKDIIRLIEDHFFAPCPSILTIKYDYDSGGFFDGAIGGYRYLMDDESPYL